MPATSPLANASLSRTPASFEACSSLAYASSSSLRRASASETVLSGLISAPPYVELARGGNVDAGQLHACLPVVLLGHRDIQDVPYALLGNRVDGRSAVDDLDRLVLADIGGAEIGLGRLLPAVLQHLHQRAFDHVHVLADRLEFFLVPGFDLGLLIAQGDVMLDDGGNVSHGGPPQQFGNPASVLGETRRSCTLTATSRFPASDLSGSFHPRV